MDNLSSMVLNALGAQAAADAQEQANMFLSVLIGFGCGLVPGLLGIVRRQAGLAILGFIACIIGSYFLGWILAIPLCITFTSVINRAANKIDNEATVKQDTSHNFNLQIPSKLTSKELDVKLENVVWKQNLHNAVVTVEQTEEGTLFSVTPPGITLEILNVKDLGRIPDAVHLDMGRYVLCGYSYFNTGNPLAKKLVMEATVTIYPKQKAIQESAGAPGTFANELGNISNLFKEGLLSPEEFAVAKKRLLESSATP